VEDERHDPEAAAAPQRGHHVRALRIVRVPREEDGCGAQHEAAVLAQQEPQASGPSLLLQMRTDRVSVNKQDGSRT
jgi:hypothetical protein